MDKPKDLGPAEIYEYILYVDSKKDPSVKTLVDSGLLPVTYIQDVNLLRHRPDYLKELPLLVKTSSKTGYKRDALIQCIEAYEAPASLKKSMGHVRTKALWAKDSKEAEATVFEARSAPLHVRR